MFKDLNKKDKEKKTLDKFFSSKPDQNIMENKSTDISEGELQQVNEKEEVDTNINVDI
jgi:hypothetical protein